MDPIYLPDVEDGGKPGAWLDAIRAMQRSGSSDTRRSGTSLRICRTRRNTSRGSRRPFSVDPRRSVQDCAS